MLAKVFKPRYRNPEVHHFPFGVFLQQKPLFKVSKNCQSKFLNFVQTFAACEIFKTFAILISSQGDRTEEKVFELKIKEKRKKVAFFLADFTLKIHLIASNLHRR